MDSFTAALGRLDPASRALLDLSLRRGMKAEEISDLLGSDPDSVTTAREVALRQLAGELDMPDAQLDELRARLAELPSEAWTGAATEERPKLSVVREEAPAKPPEEPRERSRLPLLLAILAVAAVVLVIVLASSGSNEKSTSISAGQTQAAGSTPSQAPPTPASPSKPAKAAKPSKPAPKPKPKPKTSSLAAVGAASGATGTAALTQGGKRLVVNVSGLPPADYEVWLYNSVIDAVSLTKVQGSKLSLDLKLPADATRYRYVDISREPNDGNPNHSGESVMRISLSKLER